MIILAKIINNIKYKNNNDINNGNNINNIDKQQTIYQIKILIEKEKQKAKDFIKLENEISRKIWIFSKRR